MILLHTHTLTHTHTQTLDWAAHMDELNSPSGDGLFTLSGVESDPGSTGTATPPQRLEGVPRDERLHSEQPSQERRGEPRGSEAHRWVWPRGGCGLEVGVVM